MKHGCTVRYRNKRSFVAVGGKIVAVTKKKARQSPSNVKVLLIVLREGRGSSWVCSPWSDSQWTVLLGCHEVFEGGRAKEETWGVKKQDLEAAQRQRTCSHVAPRPWIFGEARDDCRPPTAVLSRFGPFLFPRLKPTLKGRRFQMIEEIEENSLRNLRAIPQNAFQKWKNVGSGV
jgi:hypothetical protein